MVIIIASGRSIPFITKNSSVLSSIAESEPLMFTTGRTLSISFCITLENIVSSRANIRSTFPLIVFISPLWSINLFGCALSQLGFVFVENLECTIATADL